MSFFRRSWLNRMFKGFQNGRHTQNHFRGFRPELEPLEHRLSPAVYTVLTDGDGNSMPVAAGEGMFTVATLRGAIDAANNNAGKDTINFSIGGGGVRTIRVGFITGSPLPEIKDAVIIDGTTNPGYAGTPVIELSGQDLIAADGLEISAGNSTVKGLIINRFAGDGIWVRNNGNNLIVNNYIGTDKTGTQSQGNSSQGIYIESSNNTIGGAGANDRNLISGNGASGIYIKQGHGSNVIAGNYIGTDKTGTQKLGNGIDGIDMGATRFPLTGSPGCVRVSCAAA